MNTSTITAGIIGGTPPIDTPHSSKDRTHHNRMSTVVETASTTRAIVTSKDATFRQLRIGNARMTRAHRCRSIIEPLQTNGNLLRRPSSLGEAGVEVQMTTRSRPNNRGTLTEITIAVVAAIEAGVATTTETKDTEGRTVGRLKRIEAGQLPSSSLHVALTITSDSLTPGTVVDTTLLTMVVAVVVATTHLLTVEKQSGKLGVPGLTSEATTKGAVALVETVGDNTTDSN